MSIFKTIIPTSLLLTACIFETPEQKVARAQQFNGKTLAHVSDVIGVPDQQSADTAIWTFDKTVSITESVFQSIGPRGRTRYIGDITEITRFNCTYTATLDHDRIVASIYDGNSCRRFSPTVHDR